MRAVAAARSRFCTVRATLLHGDLHSGSVMVPSVGEGTARIIDPEFAFVGPVGFDLGLVLGSLLTQAARAVARDLTRHRRRVAAAAVELLDAFTGVGRTEWAQRELPAYVYDIEHREAYVDAARMGACEALRRLIYAAPVPDVEDLADDEYQVAGAWLIDAGATMLREPDLLTDRSALLSLLGGATG
jgi:5-methylthioribose kinase